MTARTIDLGREEHPVTWAEWFSRAGVRMAAEVPAELHEHLAFRVTLKDHRQFAVSRMLSFVAKGMCEVAPNRWSVDESNPVCNVITGYMLLAMDHHLNPTSLCVTPDQIASIECILLVPDADEQQDTPFGFAAYDHRKSTEDALEEVEEQAPMGASKSEENSDRGSSPA